MLLAFPEITDAIMLPWIRSYVGYLPLLFLLEDCPSYFSVVNHRVPHLVPTKNSIDLLLLPSNACFITGVSVSN